MVSTIEEGLTEIKGKSGKNERQGKAEVLRNHVWVWPWQLEMQPPSCVISESLLLCFLLVLIRLLKLIAILKEQRSSNVRGSMILVADMQQQLRW